jgi:hypothetical protein
MPAFKLEPLPWIWKSSLNATSKPVAKRKRKRKIKKKEDLPNELEVEFNLRPYHGAPETHYGSAGVFSRSK